MTEERHCPKCGAELSSEAAEGLCPKCLMQAGFESEVSTDKAYFASEGPFTETPPIGDEPVRPEELAALLPQFEILELLGRGGMGAVYKARQPGLDRIVALKIIRANLAKDPNFAERFTREARALARLSHQSIVTVHDFGQTGGLCYLVMEFVDGVNLRSLIREGKLKPEEALRIVPQICEALQFAHDEGIVHRDIKPENILIDKRGRVKIADFGLAKLLGHSPDAFTLTGTGQLMGTLGYMAPEQLNHPNAVDHRVDIYSLGVVFYEMLTGQLPIGRFELPSKKVQVDVRLDEVVLHSLEAEPDRRYQHASDVKTDVDQIRSTAAQGVSPQVAATSSSTKADTDVVKAPAIGLIIAGALHTACLLMVGLSPSRIELLLLLVSTTVGVLMLVGGAKMLRLQSQPWAITASILALLPVGPAWLLGLPMGIWSLVVLGRQDVKAAFDEKRKEQANDLAVSNADAGTGRIAVHQVKAPSIGLLIAGALSFASPIIFAAAITLLGVAGTISMTGSSSGWGNVGPWLVIGFTFGAIYAAVVMPLALVIIVGALAMKRLLARWLAITAAVIAVLPLSVAWPITLPLGIWALVVLNRRTIEAAFAMQTIDPNVLAPRIRRLGQWLRWSALLGVALDCAWLAIVTIGIWHDMSYSQSVSARQLSPDAALPAELTFVIWPFLVFACVTIIFACAGMFFVRAARKMHELQSFRAATTASILALVPISPAWVISFPLGLWSLALLSSRDAKRIFSPVQESAGNAVAESPATQARNQRFGKLALLLCVGGTSLAIAVALTVPVLDEIAVYLAFVVMLASQVIALILGVVARREPLGRGAAIASGILLLLALLLIPVLTVWNEASWVFNDLQRDDKTSIDGRGPFGEGAGGSSGPTHRPPDTPRVMTPEELEPLLWGWTFGPDGPQLKESTAQTLQRGQVEPVNKALQESYRDYLAIEKKNVEQSADKDGHLITTIRPITAELGNLEGRLWARLDPLLDPEQQNIFRLNLKLDPAQPRSGISLRELVRPGFFGWGKQGARIEIWREGAWYRWKVHTDNHEDSSTDPELPKEYRRFLKQPPEAITK